MNLQAQVEAKLKTALKEKDSARISALREILTALKYREKESGKELSPSQELEVLSKLKKQHQESISAFEKGNRPDLVEKEKAQLKVIEEFLPKPLSAEELKEMVREAIESLGAKSLKDMGKVMSALKEKYTGRADGKTVSEEVKRQLQEKAEAG